ncbi:MAG: sigma-70 family RNA polymerase sigma factor [Planctomycetes bacterium]|nr:sigma-70 family RNA polymerase sigma factor [Planctomycetota bacterium]
MADRREEFEKLVWPLLDSLLRVARRFVDAAAAEDLVQDTVLRAWRKMDLYRPGTNFKAWIFRILINSGINAIRSRTRHPSLRQLNPEATPDQEARYLRTADLAQLGEWVGDEAKAALEKVPAELKQVFVLSTFEGMTYREISETLEIPIGTVMSRLFRARVLLREELLDYARERGFRK